MRRGIQLILGLCLVSLASLLIPTDSEATSPQLPEPSARQKRSGSGAGGSGIQMAYSRYSPELNALLNNPNWRTAMGAIGQTEENSARNAYSQKRDQDRASADQKVQRGAYGNKISYILLDGSRLDLSQQPNVPPYSPTTLQKMVEAIIYVGEGDMARPSDHPSDALRSDRELRNKEISRHLVDSIRATWDDNKPVVAIIIHREVTKYEAEDREGQIVEALGGRKVERRVGQYGWDENHPTGQLRNIRVLKAHTKDDQTLTASQFNRLGVRAIVAAYRKLTTQQNPKKMEWFGGYQA